MKLEDVEKIKLKPCPFCGGDAELGLLRGYLGCIVRCVNVTCQAHDSETYYDEAKQLMKTWNYRPAEEALQVRTKELEEVLEEFSDMYDEMMQEAKERGFSNTKDSLAISEFSGGVLSTIRKFRKAKQLLKKLRS